MTRLYNYIKYHIALFKLLSDSNEYGVGDEAFDPFTGKRISWIKYEDMRWKARVDMMIELSNGSLERRTIPKDDNETIN